MNIVDIITIVIVIKVTIHHIMIPAMANHFFCFLINAIIPNINQANANGIHKNTHIIVNDVSNQIIPSIRLVVESHDFCSIFFVDI
jgi:hypothetical protein